MAPVPASDFTNKHAAHKTKIVLRLTSAGRTSKSTSTQRTARATTASKFRLTLRVTRSPPRITLRLPWIIEQGYMSGAEYDRVNAWIDEVNATNTLSTGPTSFTAAAGHYSSTSIIQSTASITTTTTIPPPPSFTTGATTLFPAPSSTTVAATASPSPSISTSTFNGRYSWNPPTHDPFYNGWRDCLARSSLASCTSASAMAHLRRVLGCEALVGVEGALEDVCGVWERK